jgi:hypothetical protein
VTELRDLADPERLLAHVQTKVQSFTKDKRKALMVSYIDARDAAQILDDVLGASAWSSVITAAPMQVGGGWTAQVAITVRIDGGEVRREDFGSGEGGLDNGAKGAVSDALKRAAVQFGVGRALYSLSPQWARTHEWAPGKFDVKDDEKDRVLDKWRLELKALGRSWQSGTPLPPPPADEEPARNEVQSTDDLMGELIEMASGDRRAVVSELKALGIQASSYLADPAVMRMARDAVRTIPRRNPDDPPDPEPAMAGQTALGQGL